MRITEIYASISGETAHAGRPCTLVRTTGCDLRCGYCDTAYAFHGGQERSLPDIIAEVQGLAPRLVLLTGGEPMLQRELPELARDLRAQGYEVMIETGGSQDLRPLPREVIRILDLKTPGSGEHLKMHWPNLELLEPKDAVKFVLTSEADYRWSAAVIREHDLSRRAEVLLSPAHGVVDPRDVVAWILRDRLPVRLNLQLHKYVWGAETRGV
jgi:7-carboxy-7-deazaguanine synthase